MDVDKAKSQWINQVWDSEIQTITQEKDTALKQALSNHEAQLKEYKDTYDMLVETQTEKWKQTQIVITKQYEQDIQSFLKGKLNTDSILGTVWDYTIGYFVKQ